LADLADQVDSGPSDHPGGLDELVAGGVEGDGEAGPVGVDAGLGAGGIGHGEAQELVADQQGMDLLVDAGGVRARSTRPPRMLDFSSRRAVSISQRWWYRVTRVVAHRLCTLRPGESAMRWSAGDAGGVGL
jgi:hypothetical protein